MSFGPTLCICLATLLLGGKVVCGERVLLCSLGHSHLPSLTVLGEGLVELGHEVTLVTHVLGRNATLELPRRGIEVVLYGDENSEETREMKRALEHDLQMSDEPSGLEQFISLMKSTPVFERFASGAIRDERAWKAITDLKPDFVIVDMIPLLSGPFIVPYKLGARYGFWAPSYYHPGISTLMPSWAPSPLGGFSDRMCFLERVANTLNTHFCNCVFYLLQKQFWESASDVPFPGLTGFSRNAEIILIGNDHVVDFALPYPPKVVLVGGQTVKESQPLPSDLSNYFNESSKGVIYMSLGTTFHHYPKNLESALRYTADRLNSVRFLVSKRGAHLNHPRILQLPKVPQTDVLGHGKLLLFISHCGMNSQYEAVNAGKPLVCLPIYADQFHNAARLVHRGAGISLDLWTISGPTLLSAIERVLDEPGLRAAAEKLSERFRQQPFTPRERGVKWVDYVIRYGGEHLQWSGEDLWWFQYMLLDVWLFVAVISILAAWITLKCCRGISRVCCCGKGQVHVECSGNKINGITCTSNGKHPKKD